MGECTFVGPKCDPLKAIHIQGSLEAVKSAVSKVSRQDSLTEFCLVVYTESSPRFVERDHVILARFLCLFQHTIQFGRKSLSSVDSSLFGSQLKSNVRIL